MPQQHATCEVFDVHDVFDEVTHHQHSVIEHPQSAELTTGPVSSTTHRRRSLRDMAVQHIFHASQIGASKRVSSSILQEIW